MRRRADPAVAALAELRQRREAREIAGAGMWLPVPVAIGRPDASLLVGDGHP